MDEYLGPGRGRPALDIDIGTGTGTGTGEGAVARYLQHELGYRATGVDYSPSTIALAAAQDTGSGTGPAWQCLADLAGAREGLATNCRGDRACSGTHNAAATRGTPI